LIKYLDLPVIPENLLEPIPVILAKPIQSTKRPIHLPIYRTYLTTALSAPLLEWVTSIFSFELIAYYQLITKGIPIHIDKNRDIAYNYLLQSGGSAVTTTMYSQYYQPIHQEIIPLHNWHSLDIKTLHGVEGIESGNTRIAISVVPLTSQH
jgi:hypothetical protein